jgi:ABC-type Fe3+-hydroxamate transport system substrate-binding protein
LGGIAALVVLAIVLVVVLGGGSSNKGKTAGTATTTAKTKSAGSGSHKKAAKAKHVHVTPPAETTVTVLNGTETTGLARRLATELQQSGYSQATPLFGRPPGSNDVTVVEYSSGHEAEAEALAHTISVTHVEPVEQAVTSMAGGASVVVVVGADRATEQTSP